MKIEISLNAKNEFLSDIIGNAISGYWAYVGGIKMTWDGSSISSIVYRDVETGKSHLVSRETVARGISMVITSPDWSDESKGRLLRAVVESDAGIIDGHDCDEIIQAGIFGKIVYG